MVGPGDTGVSCLLTSNEKQFILKALHEEHRIDGRRPLDFRNAQIKISTDGSTVTLMLGKTMVVTTIAATMEAPTSGRPNEGTLQLHVDLSPMAAPGLDSSRSAGEEPTSEVQAMLEKAIRNIKAVDLETLCIIAGRQVWRVRVDVRVLDAAGNVTDAVFLCCLTALSAFKRPEVTVENSEDGSTPTIKVHSMEEREALPLSLHQSPIAVSFALFQGEDLLVIDPGIKEEAASNAGVTVVMNAHNEVILLHKSGGLGVSLSQIMYMVKVAQAKYTALMEKVTAALEVHNTQRVAARVRRKQPSAAPASNQHIASQPATDVLSGATIHQAVGRELEALELEAAGLAESSDDESMETENKPANSIESKVKDEDSEQRPVGVGVRAPPPDLDELMTTEDAVEGSREEEDSVIVVKARQALMPNSETYQQIAAKLAGRGEEMSLQEAIKKKKRKKGKGPVNIDS